MRVCRIPASYWRGPVSSTYSEQWSIIVKTRKVFTFRCFSGNCSRENASDSAICRPEYCSIDTNSTPTRVALAAKHIAVSSSWAKKSTLCSGTTRLNKTLVAEEIAFVKWHLTLPSILSASLQLRGKVKPYNIVIESRSPFCFFHRCTLIHQELSAGEGTAVTVCL